MIAAEWKVCFGALGSGLVGVRFQARERGRQALTVSWGLSLCF